MNVLNLILADNSWIAYSYIIDIVVIFLSIVMFVWYFVYSVKKDKKQKNYKNPPLDSNIKKIDDDTYVIEKDKRNLTDEDRVEIENDSVVEHFSAQLSEIKKEELADQNDNVVLETKVPENPEVSHFDKSTLANFVNKNSGVKNNKKPTSEYNYGSNAYHEATNFFTTLKQENRDIKEFQTESKTTTASHKKTNSTSPKKKTTAKPKSANSTQKTPKKTSKTTKK